MLAGINYVPLLRGKVAEVTAYRHLSGEAKSLTLPAFLARPWQNANHFQLTVDKLRDAVEGRPFALGLDDQRYGRPSRKPAQGEFDALFAPEGGYRAYYELINSIPEASPVLQRVTSADNLLFQLSNADNSHKGLFIHYNRDSTPPVLNISGYTPPLPSDTVFLVDAGWSTDYNYLELWTLQAVQRINLALPNAEIVVMASSFPDSFGSIIGHGEVGYHERRLFSAMNQRFQQANLTYGDWASTRPAQSGGGGTIPARIDVPHHSGCNIFRAGDGEINTYSAQADAALAHACFSTVPSCYGKQAIQETSGDGDVITGPQRSTEARINIHLTIQSSAAQTMPMDETDYVD